jgi:hypothetical protein
MLAFANRQNLDPHRELQGLLAWCKAKHIKPREALWENWCMKADRFNGNGNSNQEEKLDDQKIRELRQQLRPRRIDQRTTY